MFAHRDAEKGRLLALESKDKLLAHSARREVALLLSGERRRRCKQ